MKRVDANNRGSKSPYDLLTVGTSKRGVVAQSGVLLKPQAVLANCPALDTIVIAGGRGLREPTTNRMISDWVRLRAQRFRRIVSTCTGVYALAPTGLLDGRRVVTHWSFAADLSRRFPALRVDGDALFLRDGKYYTSAGITAGIDLSLALIEEDLGRQSALRVARELVVYRKRPGGQAQYSEPLRFQAVATDELHEVDAFIRSHLGEKLSASMLARSVRLSERQFSRRFKLSYKTSPAVYVERLKLDEARSRLRRLVAGSISSLPHLASVAMTLFAEPSKDRSAFFQAITALVSDTTAKTKIYHNGDTRHEASDLLSAPYRGVLLRRRCLDLRSDPPVGDATITASRGKGSGRRKPLGCNPGDR